MINYIETDQIDFKEVCKIYQAIVRNLPKETVLSAFQNQVLTNYILKAFEPGVKTRGFYADSLPYMIPLVGVDGLDSEIENIQKTIVDMLRMENFSTKTFILIMGQLMQKMNESDS